MEVRGFGELQTAPVGVIFIYMSVLGFLGVSLCLGNKKKNSGKIKSFSPPLGPLQIVLIALWVT